MVSTFKSFLQYFRTYPLRGILTLVTIAIGVGALVITFSLSFDVGDALDENLSRDGYRITLSNSTLQDDGTYDRQFPPAFTADTTSILMSDYENLTDATVVGQVRWNSISAGDQSYQVRSAVATDAAYSDLMDLSFRAGSFFTQEDVETRRQVIAITESAAAILFGSAQSAVGQDIMMAVPVITFDQGGGRGRLSQEPYTVVGVYEDPSELKREAYGVADFIIPSGQNLPVGLPISFDPGAVIMARVVDDSIESAGSRIATILELEYGDDTLSSVWEGSLDGPTPLIEESRQSIQSFSLTLNVLGIIILLASSIGIFSIMLVEVLGRMREIGLRRALGATKAGIRRFFMAQALYFSIVGSAIGTALAFAFYRIIGGSLAPFFESSGLSAGDLNLTTPGAFPIVLAVGAAVVVGALFGFFPALSASRVDIVECIREEAA